MVTRELQGHFASFFENYEEALDLPTDKIGVWISGFFGSGKSHFLKMLSYLLANEEVAGKRAIDYFDGKMQDSLVYSKMRRCAEVPTEAILFNIDSKGGQWKTGDTAKTALLRAFERVFYENLGFFGEDLKLAKLEQFIDQQGKTQQFREAFERVNGEPWLETRESYCYFEDDIVQVLQEVLGMSESAAQHWFDGGEDDVIAADRFAQQVSEYAEVRAAENGGQFRLLFMVDEVGQFIGSDTNLMLSLQTLVEELGARCKGRVWVMVTSQEAIDEVAMIEKVPLGMTCAIEVAEQGTVLSTLSNPYGIATVFDLSSEETKRVVPIARSLIGARSGVVIKTPTGDVQERSIKAGTINIIGLKKEVDVDVDEGADKIMEAISSIQEIDDIQGETGTNVGNMLNKVRRVMAGLTNKSPQDIKIQDLLAVDTFNPQKVVGGIADEFALENAVGIAAMVKSDRLQMEMIAQVLTEKLRVPVYVGGVEADMAIKGALTTPGTSVPLAIVDMGAGSTDASIINREGKVKLIHLAGAGNMVSLLIQSELGLDDFELAEDVKKYTLAKVESLFHIRHENGTVQFFDKPLDPSIFAKVVLVKENDELVPLDGVESLEKVKAVRMEAKKKVFVTNAIRSLSKVSPTGNPRDIQFVVMVGGSALDFEIPNFVTDALADYEIVAGRGNIRGCEGPRNAVATGLAMACVEQEN